jgi:alpha-mannosidase
MESARYLVKFDAHGDVSSVFDKEAESELLQAPAGIELLDNKFTELWDDKYVDWPRGRSNGRRSTAPDARLGDPSIKVVERGPSRCARNHAPVRNSTFVQHIS